MALPKKRSLYKEHVFKGGLLKRGPSYMAIELKRRSPCKRAHAIGPTLREPALQRSQLLNRPTAKEACFEKDYYTRGLPLKNAWVKKNRHKKGRPD